MPIDSAGVRGGHHLAFVCLAAVVPGAEPGEFGRQLGQRTAGAGRLYHDAGSMGRFAGFDGKNPSAARARTGQTAAVGVL